MPQVVPVLRDRRFLLLWIGQSVSILGDTLYNLALIWWVVQVTDSGAAMSSVALAAALPRIICGPLVGVYVDRFDRRRLMLAANLANGMITAAIAFLYWRGQFSLGLIIGSAAMMGLVSTSHGPAFEAAIPSVVAEDQLVRANSLMQTANSISGLVAPALSGVLIAAAGIGASILLDAVTFLLAALSLLPVRLPRSPVATSRRSLLADAAVGFRYIARHRLLLPLLIYFAMVNLALAPMGVVVPLLLVKVLHAGPQLLGLFGSFQSAGVLAASALLSLFPRLTRRTGLTLLSSICLIGVSTVLIGLATGPVILLIASALMGMALVVANVTSQTIWQREVVDELRGRVFAARYTFGSGLRPLGLALAGPLTDWIGVRVTLAGTGLLCLASAISGWLVPGLIAYGQAAPAEQTPSPSLGS